MIVGFIKFPAKIRAMNASTTQDPSLEVIKLLWMLINKHASDLNEGKLSNNFVSKYVAYDIMVQHELHHAL